MAKTFQSYSSTPDFLRLAKQVRDNANYHGEPVPKARMRGTMKIHGTNAAVATDGVDTWLQTRERVLPDDEYHMGFREFYTKNKADFDRMLRWGGVVNPEIQIFGEWAGGGIQKGDIGVKHCEKFFTIFGINFGPSDNRRWATDDEVLSILACTGLGTASQRAAKRLFWKEDFTVFYLDVDFDTPTLAVNQMLEITNAVELDCPVARALLGPDFKEPLTGEGVVWECTLPRLGWVRCKVKGKKHSATKVKTMKAVDEALVTNVAGFVDAVCTTNRLEQGLVKLQEMGLDPVDRKNVGTYVKWVVQDCVSEEAEVLAASGLEVAQVGGPIAKKASGYILEWQKAQILATAP